MGKRRPKHSETPFPETADFVHEKVLSLLADSPSTILDVPAGQGAFASMAQKLGHLVVCGDIDSSKFRLPRTLCHEFDLNSKWPFQNESFDHVVAIEGIEHLENLWHFLRETERVLKKEGVLIITTPNILSIRSRLSYLLNGYPNYFDYMVKLDDLSGEELPVAHINPISYLELRHVLIQTGFQLEFIDTNRYLKTRSIILQLIKLYLTRRGKIRAKYEPARGPIRMTLLSPALLFGEILIIKARKSCRSDF